MKKSKEYFNKLRFSIKTKIDDFFENITKMLIKFRIIFLGVFALLVIIAMVGIPRLKLDNSIDGWFLEGAEIKQKKSEFKKNFGNSDYVALLIEANDVFAPEILELQKELSKDLEYKVPFADKAISLPNIEFSRTQGDDIIIEKFVPGEIPDQKNDIEKLRNLALNKKSIKNRIVSDDSKTAWLLLRLYPFPDEWKEEAKYKHKIILKKYNEINKNRYVQFEKDFKESKEDACLKLINQYNESFNEETFFLDIDELLLYEEYITKDFNKINKNLLLKKFFIKDDYPVNSKVYYKKINQLVKIQVNEIIQEPAMRVGEKVLRMLKYEKYNSVNFSIKSTGIPIYDVEDMKLGSEESAKLTMLGILIAIIVLIIFLRSIRGVVIPLITTVSSIILVFGFMGLLNIKLNAIIMSVPVFLGFAVSIGYSIHIFNIWKREFLNSGNRKEACYLAIRKTGWPILFTALTTIGSLLSFVLIPLVPMRWLGCTAALIILTVFIIVIVITPILLSFGRNREPGDIQDKKLNKLSKLDNIFKMIGEFVLKFSVPIIICYIIITGVLIFGVTRTEINLNTSKTYGKKVEYINRMNYIAKTKIGSFFSYDLTINFNKNDEIKKPENLKKFELLIDEVKQQKNTKKVSSLLDIIKDMNQLLNKNNEEFYSIPDKKEMVSQILLLYEFSGGTESGQWVDSDYSILRLMVELEDMDTKEIIKDLDYLKDKAGAYFPDAEISITGSMPEFAALNQYLSKGQIVSYGAALAVIMVLMMIVFGSFKIGIIGMIPNITPAITVGGLMGLLNIPLDFMTVTMVPMILGIAVDDTIHFISHAQDEFYLTGDIKEGIYKTFRIVGKSLFMTSFIIIASFSMYLTSSINMMLHLGVFLSVGIGSALISDYMITPVLLKWLKPFSKL